MRKYTLLTTWEDDDEHGVLDNSNLPERTAILFCFSIWKFYFHLPAFSTFKVEHLRYHNSFSNQSWKTTFKALVDSYRSVGNLMVLHAICDAIGETSQMSQNSILRNGFSSNITMYDVPNTWHYLIITLDVNVMETHFTEFQKEVNYSFKMGPYTILHHPMGFPRLHTVEDNTCRFEQLLVNGKMLQLNSYKQCKCFFIDF